MSTPLTSLIPLAPLSDDTPGGEQLTKLLEADQGAHPVGFVHCMPLRHQECPLSVRQLLHGLIDDATEPERVQIAVVGCLWRAHLGRHLKTDLQ